MMPTAKPFWQSKTLLVSLLSLVVIAVGGVLDVAGVLQLTAQQVAIVTVVLAVVTGALRILSTSQPLSVGDKVPSLR